MSESYQTKVKRLLQFNAILANLERDYYGGNEDGTDPVVFRCLRNGLLSVQSALRAQVDAFEDKANRHE